jgi:small subunit ribosomal protein S6
LAAAREYELVLMLDPGGDEVTRDALAQEAKAQIEAAGTVKHESNWGLRKMAYEIAQRNEADYRWFRFEGPTELLDSLNHNLRIADGVLRFRIFKVDAQTPTTAPPATAAPASGAARERHGDGGSETAEEAPEAAEPAEPAKAAAPVAAQQPADGGEEAAPATEAAVPEAPAEGDGESSAD